MEWFFLTLAVVCKSCRDVCEWNWADSIFYPITYFRHDWERAYNPLTGERVKWLGIPIPHLLFDGWHLFEWLLWFNVGLALYYAEGTMDISVLIRVGILVAVVHYITYKKLLRRSFWKR